MKSNLIFLIILLPLCVFAQWIPLESGTDANFYAVDFRNPNCGWISGGSNRIMQTTDGGQSWDLYEDYTWPEREVWKSLSYVDKNSLYACGHINLNGYAQENWTYSIDDGKSWEAQRSWGIAKGGWNDVFFSDINHGWKVGSYSGNARAKKTSEGVEGNWETVSIENKPSSFFSVFFIDENNGWITGAQGTIFKTTDAGVNWDLFQSNENYTLSEIYFIDDQNGWIVGRDDDAGIILKTRDGGDNWDVSKPANVRKLYDICFMDANVGWACGSGYSLLAENGVILRTKDGGSSWQIQHHEYQCSSLNGLDIENGVVYAVGNAGVVLKNIVGSDFLHFEDADNMPAKKYAFGSVSDGSKIYSVCGTQAPTPWNQASVSNSIEVYDPNTDNWGKLYDGLIPRLHCSAEIISSSDKMYVFNGYSHRVEHFSDTLELIDLSNGAISYLSPVPYPTVFGGSAVMKDKIYVFGGKNEDGYSKRFYEYDTSTDSWTRLPDMPEPKITSGEIVNGKLYIFGGEHFFASKKIHAYDFDTESWSHVGDLPFNITSSSIAKTGKYIWLISSVEDPVLVSLYDTEMNEFTQIYSDMIKRTYAGAEVIDYKLYVFGGMDEIEDEEVMLNGTQYALVGDFVDRVYYDDPESMINSIVFPNPFRQSVKLTYSIPVNGPVKVSVHAFSGRLLHVDDHIGHQGINSRTLDLCELSTGIYYLSIEYEGSKEIRKLFKLQN